MKILNILSTIVFMVFLYAKSVCAYPGNLSVWQIKSQNDLPIKVVLISDWHLENKMDKDLKLKFFSLLNRLKEREKSSILLVEAPENFSLFDFSKVSSREVLMNELAQDNLSQFLYSIGTVATFGSKFGSIICQRGDIRSKKLGILNYVITCITEDRDAELELLKSDSLIEEVCAVHEFFQEMHDVSARLKMLTKHFHEEEISTSFDLVAKGLDQAILEAKSFFASNASNETQLVSNVFFSYFEQDGKQKAEEFLKPTHWLQKASSSCADIGFLEKFLTAMQQDKDIIFIAGAAHTAVHFELLKKLEVKSRAGCIYLQGKDFTPQEVEVACLQQKFGPGLSISQFELGLNIFEQSCFSCHKSVGKMKTCGACKVAKYCSADCQKADWTKHKKMCKK